MEYEKILLSRLSQSFVWTIVLHIFPLSFFIILTNFDPVHPVTWLLNSAYVIFSLKTWLSILPLLCLVFVISYLFLQEFKQQPPLLTSRFKVLCSVFTKNNMLKLFLYVFIGFLLPVSYLSLIEESLTYKHPDNPEVYYLKEENIFISSCAVWTALYYFVRCDLLSEKYLQFPIIRQLRFLQIKSKFYNVFRSCLKSSIIPVFYYFIIYFWYQKQINFLWEGIAATYSEKLMTISEFLSLRLLFKAWMMSSVYFIIINTLKLMMEIHFTEHYSFELIKQPYSDSVLLPTALGEENVPIIQHLACYNLYNLSRSKKASRWQVFTLSQPGGHPHIWNSILCESLKIIDKFVCEIQETFKTPEPEKPKPQVPKHYHMRDRSVRYEEIFTGPVPLSPTSKIRKLVENPIVPIINQQPTAKDEIWMKMEGYLSTLQQNTVINYIFGSKCDVKIRYLVSQSQPLIWVVQSISELSANALMEDQFGIVLKDLPLIINTLLRLRCTLEKIGSFQKKFQKRDHEFFMRASLKSAVKRSLYRIAIAYSDYLTDLPLPPENLVIMKNFVNFKEC